MPLQLPQELITAASDRAVELTKARLGVEELTPEIAAAIAGKVSDSASTGLMRDLDGIAASAVSGVSGKIRVKESLSVGVEALKQVVDDEKYAELVIQSARMTHRNSPRSKTPGSPRTRRSSWSSPKPSPGAAERLADAGVDTMFDIDVPHLPDPGEVIHAAAGAIESGVETVKDCFEDAGEWAYHVAEGLGATAADIAEGVAKAVDEGARLIAHAAEELGESLAATAEKIGGALATVVDEIGDAITDLVELAEGVAEWFASTVVDVVDWLVDEALPFLEGVIKTVLMIAWIFATLPVWLAAILICAALSREAGHEEGTLLRGVMDPDSRVAEQLRIRRLPAAGRYVIFSDLHRYCSGDLDIPNQNRVIPIYVRTLQHYLAEQTWTVIENGDVEDYWLRGGSLWGVAYDAASGFIGPISDVAFEGSAGAVATAHLSKVVQNNRSVYELLRALHDRRQYFRTIGNHDDVYRSERMVRELGRYFPGIEVDEYIVLDGPSSAEAIISHGHASDAWNTPICSFIGRTTTSLASALNELLPDRLEQGVPDAATTQRMLNRDADNVLTEVNRWVGVTPDFSSLDERSIHEGYRSEFGERGPMLVLGHTHAVRLSAWDPDLDAPWSHYLNEGCGIFRDILTCLEWDGQKPPAERAKLVAWLPDGTRREFAMRGRDKLELRQV